MYSKLNEYIENTEKHLLILIFNCARERPYLKQNVNYHEEEVYQIFKIWLYLLNMYYKIYYTYKDIK